MNIFNIKEILVTGNRIDYIYEITGDWKQYFNPAENFFVEYHEDISGLSQGMAVIPLISSVLPLAALFGAKIHTPVIDKDFYESIPHFMNGYYEMWKDKSDKFCFEYENILTADTLQQNVIEFAKDAPSLLYFSGGVDAYSSLIRHEEENLIILTVCGADTYYNNKKGLEVILRKNQEIADSHHVKMLYLISSFRKFIDENRINDYLVPLIEDNYWHAFQHSVGMFGLSVGYIHKYGIQKIYFASSFSSKDKLKIRCGSDPTIDNLVRIANLGEVSHDLFELGRQDKIKMLADYHERTRRPVKLRVCYRSTDGENCCKCEKCIRTIMGILAENKDPREFGFDYEPDKIYLRFTQVLKQTNRERGKEGLIQSRFEEIQHKLRKIYPEIEKAPKELQFFLSSDIEQLSYFLELPEEESVPEKKTMSAARALIDKVTVGNTFFLKYFEENPEEYTIIYKKMFDKINVREAQKSSQWIGNHGFMLDSSASVEKEGNRLRIHADSETIVLQGWAADFQEEQPLADVLVRIGETYYPLNYGQPNMNLGIKYNNESLVKIGFYAELPIEIFVGDKIDRIGFYMIGIKGDTIYRYPEISYEIYVV